MEIRHSMRDGCLVVHLTSSITVLTAPRIQRTLLKDLAERPYGIVCDLGGGEVLKRLAIPRFLPPPGPLGGAPARAPTPPPVPARRARPGPDADRARRGPGLRPRPARLLA